MANENIEQLNLQNLPTQGFVAFTSNWQGDLLDCRSLYDAYSMRDPVLESTPLNSCDWATLFAYMHRRFGPPHIGGDDYKDLSGKWVLSTPDPAVFLLVNPSLSGPGFSFTPCITHTESAAKRIHRASDLGLSADRVAEVKDAYKAGLLDLLRPVSVRNNHINALGEVLDSPLDEALLHWDEENNQNSYVVDRHASSGFSIPSGLFGGKDWVTLCSVIDKLGEGDINAGRSKAIALLREQAFSEAAFAPWAVQRLMLLQVGNELESFADGLGLDVNTRARFGDERKALYDREAPNYSIVDEMTDAAIDEAHEFLQRLGYGDTGLGNTVRKLRRDKAVSESWKDLVEVTNKKFPDQVMLPENPYAINGDLAAHLAIAFDGIGRADLSNWATRTHARPEGSHALADIIYHISAQRRNQQGCD